MVRSARARSLLQSRAVERGPTKHPLPFVPCRKRAVMEIDAPSWSEMVRAAANGGTLNWDRERDLDHGEDLHQGESLPPQALFKRARGRGAVESPVLQAPPPAFLEKSDGLGERRRRATSRRIDFPLLFPIPGLPCGVPLRRGGPPTRLRVSSCDEAAMRGLSDRLPTLQHIALFMLYAEELKNGEIAGIEAGKTEYVDRGLRSSPACIG